MKVGPISNITPQMNGERTKTKIATRCLPAVCHGDPHLLHSGKDSVNRISAICELLSSPMWEQLNVLRAENLLSVWVCPPACLSTCVSHCVGLFVRLCVSRRDASVWASEMQRPTADEPSQWLAGPCRVLIGCCLVLFKQGSNQTL